MNTLLSGVTGFVFAVIMKFSYVGLVLLMAAESCNIPLPSELIMPYAGFLSHIGSMNMHIAAFAGAIGCVIGSAISYAIGYYGGRPLLEKYGKYILLSKDDLDFGERLFSKHGDIISLVSRVLPIIRTFISFPAGVLKMNFKKFIAYSFIGSLIWSYILIFVGIKIGDNQKILSTYFHKFDVVIEILIVLAVTTYIYRHVQKMKK